MARAIALSLGDRSTEQEKETKQPEVEQKEDEINYIEQTVLDDFTNRLLAGCLQLLDHVPKAVHSVCDLITIAAKRNGKAWKQRVLADLFKEVTDCYMIAFSMTQKTVKVLPSFCFFCEVECWC